MDGSRLIDKQKLDELERRCERALELLDATEKLLGNLAAVIREWQEARRAATTYTYKPVIDDEQRKVLERLANAEETLMKL